MYYWKAYSTDGSFEDESLVCYQTKKEAYNSMRDAALDKMKWNTEYDEDFNDLEENQFILYEAEFTQDKIIHRSYSGEYVYEIKMR